MNYTTYLFDFDYTLADSSRGIVTCFRNVLNRHGYTHPTDNDIKRTIGKTLEDSLSILSGVADVQTPKPSPEGLLLAIRQLHVTKAETLYIGDSTVDAETAQRSR